MPERAVFVKTSLHSPIFGDRRLHAWKVARSVGLSGLVQESLPDLPNTLRYFPESFGMVPPLLLQMMERMGLYRHLNRLLLLLLNLRKDLWVAI